ncbi:hypothetical protein [Nocardiopsis potens]|uniref:hypothetical protein n=1 Tax=Nocardiopsis potens TaxID=1246458 RepID=UPI000345B746|nr:hypothetical protein [Nocardiopsis potens]
MGHLELRMMLEQAAAEAEPAADFPGWCFFRHLLDGPGRWRGVRAGRAVSAPGTGELREPPARIELAEADR